jgi:xanthine dehydrogenase accessory factor
MRRIYAAIAERLKSGASFAVATLVGMGNAAPAPLGTPVVVDADGSFLGNIGAGCHEGTIVEAARDALRDRRESTLEFDVSDELLDGAACGASLTVAVWVPDSAFLPIAEAIVCGRESVRFSCAGHLVTLPRKRSLTIVGATALAAALTDLAAAADFFVSVVDPRAPFATWRRHPNADRLLVAWPQDVLKEDLEHTDAIVAMAHDVKIDLPALRCALESNVPYVGALGSRRAQRARQKTLLKEGYRESALARIHGPAGLDLGGATESEVACSIFAEILCALNARSGASLRRTDGTIHAPAGR